MKVHIAKLGWFGVWLALGIGFARSAEAIQIVAENRGASCELLQLHGELKVFKDPSIFLANLALIFSDPAFGWKALMRENPLLMTVQGKFELMRLGPARPFQNFGAIAHLYEAAEPRLKLDEGEGKQAAASIVPIHICGTGYSGFLGFVLDDDLRRAQQNRVAEAGMPPSTYPNPIPQWKTPSTSP